MDIKDMIKNYIKLDDELSELSKQTVEMRKARTIMEENIKEYMLNNSIAKVEIGSGFLKISKSKPNKKINKKNIMSVLLDSLPDHNKANEIIEEIFKEDEDIEEITKLERTKKNKN